MSVQTTDIETDGDLHRTVIDYLQLNESTPSFLSGPWPMIIDGFHSVVHVDSRYHPNTGDEATAVSDGTVVIRGEVTNVHPTRDETIVFVEPPVR